MKEENLPCLIITECVFHNMCETREEIFMKPGQRRHDRQSRDGAPSMQSTGRLERKPSSDVEGPGPTYWQGVWVHKALASYLQALGNWEWFLNV